MRRRRRSANAAGKTPRAPEPAVSALPQEKHARSRNAGHLLPYLNLNSHLTLILLTLRIGIKRRLGFRSNPILNFNHSREPNPES